VPASAPRPAAFLAVVAKPGRVLSLEVQALLDDRAPASLAFTPTNTLSWSDRPGAVRLAAWEAGPAPAPPSAASTWCAHGESVTLTLGSPRWAGRTWSSATAWHRELADALAAGGVRAVTAGLRGSATVVVAHPDRGLTVACDPMGLAFAYAAESPDLVAVSSVAALAALAVTPVGTRPARDARTAAPLAGSPYVVGCGTGFAGVRLLPESAVLTMASDRGAVEGGTLAPWLDHEPVRGCTPDELIDGIVEEVADELRAALAASDRPPVVDLTGGKDSRLVLAVSVLAGLADELVFRTVGPPELADVRVATSLTQALGLRHEVSFTWASPEGTYRDRALAFLDATAGTVNIWDAKAPEPPLGEVRVSGTTGECLRAHDLMRPTPPGIDSIVRRRIRSLAAGSLPLLRPEARQHLEDELRAALLAPEAAGAHPIDRLGTCNVRNRARKYRGPLDALESDPRVYPLCGLEAVRRAFALGPDARQEQLIHFEACRRASPILVDHPFAGAGWYPEVLARVAATGAGPGAEAGIDVHVGAGARGGAAVAAEPAPVSAPAPKGKAEALMARVQRDANHERDELFRELLADAENPAWEALDRAAAADALDAYDTLTAKQRRQLFGSMSAALWCS
jgi:hypothetical protein